jgi:hypothetical protein
LALDLAIDSSAAKQSGVESSLLTIAFAFET